MIYTRYKIPVKRANSTTTVTFDSEEFRVGVDLGLGVGQRIAKLYMLRLDAKYYFEKNHYLGWLASFQVEY